MLAKAQRAEELAEKSLEFQKEALENTRVFQKSLLAVMTALAKGAT